MDGVTIFLICLLGVFLLYSIYLMFRRSKADKANNQMLDQIKVGDKVKTHVGIYGKIISITETTDGKVIVLETGDDKNKMRLEMDYRVVAGIDAKQMAIYDENNNLIKPEAEKIEEKEKQIEPVKLEKVAVKLDDVATVLDKPGELENISKEEKKQTSKKTKSSTKK